MQVADQCPSDTKCTPIVACNTSIGCIGTVLATWDAKSAGDVLGNGWKLRDDALCTISKGGTSIPGLAATDGFGLPRTDPRSMGAHESDACK